MDAIRRAFWSMPGALNVATTAPVMRCAWAALAVTAMQIAGAVAASGYADPVAGWRSLCQWDGGWYAGIVERGYDDVPDPMPKRFSSVGFFPGYALTGRLIQCVLAVDTVAALLIASQAAAAVFYFYLLLLMRGQRASWPIAAAAVVVLTAHPAAYFLVAGYSESQFLAALLGYVHWSRKRGGAAWALAALHGVAMTGTRLVGLPLVLLPLLAAWLVDDGRPLLRRIGIAASLALVSTAGAAAFFGYCHLRFQRWDIYFEAQRIGWGVTPDYFAMFRPRTYGLPYLAVGRLFTDVAHLNRVAAPAALAGLAGLAGAEIVAWRSRRLRRSCSAGSEAERAGESPAAPREVGAGGWRERLPLMLAAFLLLYIPLSSYASLQMLGMLRYSLCVEALGLLCVTGLARDWPEPLRRRLAIASAPFLLAAFACQAVMVWRFTHGLVVA